jgi:5'-nucleotidase
VSADAARTSRGLALITNDDGIDSAGLTVLARAAIAVGLEVVVAAPESNSSGASAALSAMQADGRLLTREVSLDGLAGVHAFAVEASPALIAFVGSRGAFGPTPDVVLSGVNHGSNTGHATIHSGTVGAAITAASHGRRALAVSVASMAPEHWPTVSRVCETALAWTMDHDVVGTVISVNVPDIALTDLRGLRSARLAPFGAVQAIVNEAGEGFVSMTFSDVDQPAEPDTDTALLGLGWATATALRAPCESPHINLSSIGSRMEEGVSHAR